MFHLILTGAVYHSKKPPAFCRIEDKDAAQMTYDENRFILSLFFTKGVSSAFLRQLLENTARTGETIVRGIGELAGFCNSPSELLAVKLAQSPGKEVCTRLDQTFQWLQEPNNNIVFASDLVYPALLREISDYPPVLFVKGNVDILRRPMLAIVGSRSCSAYGRSVAYKLSAALADKGFVICSGLASGIDTQAHLAALDSKGTTVAVLGNGLHSVYPGSNQSLANRIVSSGVPEAGAIISELPLDAGPVAQHFPQRNRIISGLSLGVCVVEANMRSGSLITARLALEQNREIFSVPGSINSPGSRGCHKLLRQGAILTENAQDIFEHIQFICQAQLAMCYPQFQLAGTNNNASKDVAIHNSNFPAGCDVLYRELCEDGISIETLMLRTGQDIGCISEKLLLMEVNGFVAHNGGLWRRIQPNE
ncbi:MAG: DNA-processing protein DprA [Pseudohongiella sp.]|nr:DNA-processing protein DprA [Pseudohongiella sp.]